jgi:hypothetical protein
MPELVEPLDKGRDDIWRARLANGHEVLAERAPGDVPEEARRLADLSSPHLVRLLGAASRDGQSWLIWEPDGGLPLSLLLNTYSLTPGQAVAAISGVLAGLAALQAAGRGHGAIASGNVLVGRGGSVRLVGFAGPRSSPAEDLQAAGALACSLLGIPIVSGQKLHRAESWTPALAVQSRALAGGRMGADAALALGLMQDSAGRLAAPENLEHSRHQLAAMAAQPGGPGADAARKVVPLPARLRPSNPPAPRPAVIVPARPMQHSAWALSQHRAPDERRWGPAAAVLAAGLGLVVLTLVWLAGFSHRSPLAALPATHTQATAAPAPAPTRNPATPAPTAAGIPASAGDVQAVKMTPEGQCAPGAACSIRVDLTLNRLPASEAVSYVFDIKDRCTGATSEVGGSSIPAQQGWTSAWGVSQVTLPAARALDVVAVTTAPARAASPPLTVGAGC